MLELFGGGGRLHRGRQGSADQGSLFGGENTLHFVPLQRICAISTFFTRLKYVFLKTHIGFSLVYFQNHYSTYFNITYRRYHSSIYCILKPLGIYYCREPNCRFVLALSQKRLPAVCMRFQRVLAGLAVFLFPPKK